MRATSASCHAQAEMGGDPAHRVRVLEEPVLVAQHQMPGGGSPGGVLAVLRDPAHGHLRRRAEPLHQRQRRVARVADGRDDARLRELGEHVQPREPMRLAHHQPPERARLGQQVVERVGEPGGDRIGPERGRHQLAGDVVGPGRGAAVQPERQHQTGRHSASPAVRAEGRAGGGRGQAARDDCWRRRVPLYPAAPRAVVAEW